MNSIPPARPLPAYRVVESPRARHLRLRVSRQRGLEVIVPRGYDQRRIPRLLEQKQRWIQRAQDRIGSARPLAEPGAAWVPPISVTFPAIGRTWGIEHDLRPTTAVSLHDLSDRLLLRGALADRRACRLALQRWLILQARLHLVPHLQLVSVQVGLPLARIQVRCQRSRWGSCSRTRTISLNARLLFLESNLVRYVFIHELCHTVHLNHSAAYWRLVQSKDPDYKPLDRALKTAWRHIPAWASLGPQDD